MRHPGRLGKRDRAASDAGFTLVEVMVSIAIMGIVMTALTTFFISTSSLLGQQRDKQTAIQLAQDGIERVRALKGSAVGHGRQECTVVATCALPPAAVEPYLTQTQPWNAAVSGSTPALPFVEPVKLNNVSYERRWYVGRCWQTSASDTSCVATPSIVALYRVVVSVTWAHKRCAAESCSYVTSTLVSSDPNDPVFNPDDIPTPPAVENPGALAGDVTFAVDLTLKATSDAGPIMWTQTGLPPGLTMDTTGRITGTPTTPGVYPVKVSAKDRTKEPGTAEFTWTINALPKLVQPTAQSTPAGNAATLALTVNGGTAPLAFTATNLPTGLAINPTTGVISGTPTTTMTRTVTVTVQDHVGATNSVSFQWTVVPRPTITAATVAARNDALGAAISLQAAATGGTGAYTWSAVDLPSGLTITPAGLISGTLSAGTRFLPTLTVTDAAGVSHSVSFEWRVTTNSQLRVTVPTVDRTDPVGTAINFTATSTGGPSPTWTATGLPTGVTITASNGKLAGTPTAPGTYTTRLTVTSNNGKTAVFMLVWTIQ